MSIIYALVYLSNMEEQHLIPICFDEDSSCDDCENSDDDSSLSVEVTSTIDENENELLRLSTNLKFNHIIWLYQSLNILIDPTQNRRPLLKVYVL